MHKKTIEEYLEVIGIFQESGGRASTNDVATYMKINPASVTEMFGKLMAEGYVDYVPYHGARLTPRGQRVVNKLMKKHRTLADFLKTIGVDSEIAELDACRIEHVIEDATLAVLRGFSVYLQTDEGQRFLETYRKRYNIR